MLDVRRRIMELRSGAGFEEAFMQNAKSLVGIGAVALGIIGSGLIVGAVGAPSAQLPITGAEMVVTGAHFGTAASLARPFAGPLAANRLTESAAYAHAADLVAGDVNDLSSGITARAVLQSLAAQGNDVVTSLPATWR